jgi:hypothetical protein
MWQAESGSSYPILSAITYEGLIRPYTSMTVFHFYLITSMMSLVPTFSQINFTIVQHLPSNCYHKNAGSRRDVSDLWKATFKDTGENVLGL